MKFGFVDEHRAMWPVRVMCDALGLSASGYYAWRTRPESARSTANRALIEDIRLIHSESSGTYGTPRVHAVLRAHGRRLGRSRIEHLMRRAGIRGLAALPEADPHNRQPPWLAYRTQQARPHVHDAGFKPGLVGRSHLHSHRRRLALSGGDHRHAHPKDCRLVHAPDSAHRDRSRRSEPWPSNAKGQLRCSSIIQTAVFSLSSTGRRNGPVGHLQVRVKCLGRCLPAKCLARSGVEGEQNPLESFFHTLKTQRVHHRV